MSVRVAVRVSCGTRHHEIVVDNHSDDPEAILKGLISSGLMQDAVEYVTSGVWPVKEKPTC